MCFTSAGLGSLSHGGPDHNVACPLAVVPLRALDQEEEVGKLRFPELHFVWCGKKLQPLLTPTPKRWK